MGEGFKVQHQLYEPPPPDTNVYLYNEGDECTALTGGWVISFTAGSGSQAKNTDHLYTHTTDSSAYRSYRTANRIDFTPFTTIFVEVEITSARLYEFGVFADTGMDIIIARKQVTTITTGKAIFSLDVSAINDLNYFHLCSRDYSTEAKTYKVWGE